MQKLNIIPIHTGRIDSEAEPKEIDSITGMGVYADGDSTRDCIETPRGRCPPDGDKNTR